MGYHTTILYLTIIYIYIYVIHIEDVVAYLKYHKIYIFSDDLL